MWLRTALLLVLALLAWKFVSGLVRSLTAPDRNGDVTPKPGPGAGSRTAESGAASPRGWPPSDVVDVPFRDAAVDERASSR
jgi:hypothetical protein